jgi:hypothetical protein
VPEVDDYRRAGITQRWARNLAVGRAAGPLPLMAPGVRSTVHAGVQNSGCCGAYRRVRLEDPEVAFNASRTTQPAAGEVRGYWQAIGVSSVDASGTGGTGRTIRVSHDRSTTGHDGIAPRISGSVRAQNGRKVPIVEVVRGVVLSGNCGRLDERRKLRWPGRGFRWAPAWHKWRR